MTVGPGPTFSDVSEGDELPTLVLPITRSLIVSGAIASRDYQDVHHDPVLAKDRGSKDIFMNILTTNGLVGRYITDWSGPRSTLSEVDIRLGAPNYPDCTMTLTGSVTAKGPLGDDGTSGMVTVTIRGANELGDHVTGTVKVILPLGEEPSAGGGSGAGVGFGRWCLMAHTFSGTTAVAGIGATEFSKDSGRSELRLAVEAVAAALEDAGVTPSEVQGMVTFSSDTNPDIDIARSLGIGELSFFSRIHYGGGAACATIQQAALAVSSGVADVVVCYRAFNERSGNRFGAGVQGRAPMPNAENADMASYLPVGLLTPASWVAMAAQRYLHMTGATSEDLGRIAVADRKHAATNPKAWFYEQPITLEEHQASRWIVEPLHLLDCCQETDGAQALVVTSLERARDLRTTPVVIRAAAQGSGAGQDMMTSYYRDDLLGLPEMAVVARQLWANSGLGPDDMQAAILYDHFTPYVLYQFGGAGVLRQGGGQGLRARRSPRAGRRAADQHARWPAGRGLPARHERDRRGGSAGTGHLRQPSRGSRACRRDGWDRRADQRAGARRRSLSG